MNGDTPAPCPQLRKAGRCHYGSAGTPVPHQSHTSPSPAPHQPHTSPAPVRYQSGTSPTSVPHQSHVISKPVPPPVPHLSFISPEPVPRQSHGSPATVPRHSQTSPHAIPTPPPHRSHSSPAPVPSLPCWRDVPPGVSHTAVLLAVCGAASAGRLIDALGTGRRLFLSASSACQCSWGMEGGGGGAV